MTERTGLPAPLPKPTMSAQEAAAALVGAWELDLWTTFHSDGTESHPFGTDAIGVIMYSDDGHMSCHLSLANRPLFNKLSVFDVTDTELGQSMRGYSSYFGTFSMDMEKGEVIHHVIGAWYPDFATVDQPRRFAIEGDRLFLEANVGEDLVRIAWRRRDAGTLPRG